jgi:hypothetical protein
VSQVVVCGACLQEELYGLASASGGGDHHVYPQAVEVALLGGDVSPEALALIHSATTDADVVTHRDGEGVHHVFPGGVVLLEDGGQASLAAGSRIMVDGVGT